jgi:hypothetical protein
MKKHTLLTVMVCSLVWVGPGASEQPAADCTPNALNIPGAPYPCIHPDRRVTFRVMAPDAQKVRVRLGQGLDMSKEADGFWYVTTAPQVVGFHYYTLSIDGATVADPATRTFFGSGFYNSAFEVPEPGTDGGYYSLKPEGRRSRHRASAVVPVKGDRELASRLRLHAAGLRHQHEDEVSRVVSVARMGRERAGLARAGPRGRDLGQPHRPTAGQAHDHRDGQPECRKAR